MTVSDYGQIAESQAINAFIYRCFEELGENEQRIFVNKFRRQPHDRPEVMHTFRELILGAFLHAAGFPARYEKRLLGKTPDWVIVDADGTPLAIVELVNIHIDFKTELYLQKQRQRGAAVMSYRRDGNANNPLRLYKSLQKKAEDYQELVTDLNLPYVITAFGGFETAFDGADVLACVEEEPGGLFALNPHVSGVLYFEENGGRYNFQYFGSPVSRRRLELPAGDFPENEKNHF